MTASSRSIGTGPILRSSPWSGRLDLIRLSLLRRLGEGTSANESKKIDARRLSANLEQEANVRRWCEQRGLTLRITNEGHHWQITDGGFLAEWWPSSAKLVIGKKWHDGIHCHDEKQALKVIEDFHRKKRL